LVATPSGVVITPGRTQHADISSFIKSVNPADFDRSGIEVDRQQGHSNLFNAPACKLIFGPAVGNAVSQLDSATEAMQTLYKSVPATKKSAHHSRFFKTDNKTHRRRVERNAALVILAHTQGDSEAQRKLQAPKK